MTPFNLKLFLWGLLLTLLTFPASSQSEYKVSVVGFYNLENIFDTENDTTIKDDDFTPDGDLVWTEEKYWEKQANLARVISEIGTDYAPDGLAVLGVAEVENRKVLEDLVQQAAIKNRNFKVIHEHSPDKRGIDVSFLYREKYFQYEGHRCYPVKLKELDEDNRPTRDVMHVWGELYGEDVHFFVNHWPSRSGGEAATVDKRKMAAQVNKKVVDSLLLEDPHAKIIVMGDFNDDPTSASIKKVLDVKGNKRKVRKGELYGPFEDYYKKGLGTLAYRDSWNLFDQIILSYGLIDPRQKGLQLYKAGIFKKDYLISKKGNFKGYPFRTYGGSRYQGGYSDHLPVYCVLVKPVN